MVEWFKAAVLKTAEGRLSEGSNPSSSAIFFCPFFKHRYAIPAKNQLLISANSNLLIRSFLFALIFFAMQKNGIAHFLEGCLHFVQARFGLRPRVESLFFRHFCAQISTKCPHFPHLGLKNIYCCAIISHNLLF